MDTDSTAVLPGLEAAPWQPATRYDRALVDRLLADDFHAFGRSGRRWTRAELLPDGPGPAFAATLHGVRLKALAPTVALVTYQSEMRRAGGPVEWANRAPVWDSASGRWRLRFHQGTPTPPPDTVTR
jgi:hypothetical protein